MKPRPSSEVQLQTAVIELVKLYGGRHYHSYDSRRSPSGWPDLVIVFPGRSMFRELKTATGRVTKDQQWWLDILQSAGHDVGVWRPVDLREGRIPSELREARRMGQLRLKLENAT